MDKEKLRKQVMLLANKVNEDLYRQRKSTIGRVLTVIDASFSDPEQRKAVKDIVNEIFYGPSYWNNIDAYYKAFVRANGIEKLYDEETAELITSDAPIHGLEVEFKKV